MRQSLLITLFYIVSFVGCAEAQVSWTQLTEIPVPEANRSLYYGEEFVQRIDVYEASQKLNGESVMLIHGGCWLNQYDRYYMGHLAAALSDEGYRVYNIGYRRVGDDGGGYPGTFDDVSSAFQAVKLDITEMGGDVSTITVAGHSAGGHLALWLASTDTTVGRVVGIAAISDLSEYARGSGSCQTATPRLMGGSPDEIPSDYNAADPIFIANPKAEIVLISAEGDVIVPPSHNANYVLKTGAKHIVYPGVGHFDLVAPISRVWKDVLSVISDR